MLILKGKLLAMGLGLVCCATAQGMNVVVTTSADSPTPVGTMITFSAAVPDAPSSNLWYRFRVRRNTGTYRMVRDYGPGSTLNWTASDQEGAYEMEISARDLDTGDESTTTSQFHFQSLVTSAQPVVSPTSNSLVFLYSAPSCPVGLRIRVQFQSAGGVQQNTHYKNCTAGSSMNFYLAGLMANTTYSAQHIVDDGFIIIPGPSVTFTTGNLPPSLYSSTVIVPSAKPNTDPILLGGTLGYYPVASDLSGNVLWYGPWGFTFLTSVEAGGEFWGIVETPGLDPSQQIVQKFDLLGMTLLETNAARVNEQLTNLGKRNITGFHHEARTLPDGNIAVLAAVEQVLSDVQGPGPVDVLGDMIVVMDKDLNVVWTWDTFDNLDVHRSAILREKCPAAGCPPFYLAATSNDWTHGNALQGTPDGNILYSTRNQDWVIKISYQNAAGDGHIVWRMGIDGDFQINSDDPFPWFSHQHDPNFQAANPQRLMVFDNGNTRVASMKGNSRGLVLMVDEQNRVVTPVLSADLGVYSAAVGSAQRLRDGDYQFDAGLVQENNTLDAYSIETNARGEIQYKVNQNTSLYRIFRMTDLYTPN
jgi:arylsulfate sulfotransferase